MTCGRTCGSCSPSWPSRSALAGPASYISDIIGESTRNPAMRKDFQAIVQQRRSLCAEIVAQARQRGEVRKSIDPDLVLDLISGAIFYRKLFSDDEADAAYVEAAIDAVLDGILVER